MTIKRVGGSADPGASLAALAARVKADRSKYLRAMGVELVAAIKEELSKPGTGRWYRRPRRDKAGKIRRSKSGKTIYGKPHRASAPGEPPAVDTGALRNSIHYVERRGLGIVGTNMRKAPALEFGTNTAGKSRKVRIAKRPFFRPAKARVEKKLGRTIAQALKVSIPKK